MPNSDELKNIKNLRRSAYLIRNLKKNEKIFEKDIIWQRPHLSSQKNIDKIFGKKILIDLKKGSLILKKHFK